jgi:hypothetical protein
MSAEVEKLQKHLEALETFMSSDAYVGYLSARDEEIRIIEQRILMTPPITEINRADVLLAHGELDCQKDMKQTFEDARGTLKARIDEMIERDNQTATETKV